MRVGEPVQQYSGEAGCFLFQGRFQTRMEVTITVIVGVKALCHQNASCCTPKLS